MIIPDLNRKDVQWDMWKAFHWTSHPVTVFDTQELVYTHGAPDPDYRRRYSDYRFSVLGTTDNALPTLYLPDTDDQDPVPKAWLNEHGMQYLLIDEETKRAVALGDLSKNHLVPQRLRARAKAYFAGPGSPPIGAPIRVSRPLAKVFDKDELELIDSLKAACDMQFSMTTSPTWDKKDGYYPDAVGLDPKRLLAAGSVSALTNNEQYKLFHRGVSRARQNCDYLLAL